MTANHDTGANKPTMIDVLRLQVKDLEAQRTSFIQILQWFGQNAYTYAGQKLIDTNPQIRELLEVFATDANNQGAKCAWNEETR